MGLHLAMHQVRSTDTAAVLGSIDAFWRARGARPANGNPLRLRPPHGFGHAVFEPRAGWIAVTEVGSSATEGLADHLASSLATTCCTYEIEDTVNHARLFYAGPPDEPVRARDVLDHVERRFGFALISFDSLLDAPAALRAACRSVGYRRPDTGDDGAGPQPAIWAALEAGDADALHAALAAAPRDAAAQAIARADLFSPSERAALAALPLPGLDNDTIAALVGRAIDLGDDALVERWLPDVAVNLDVARAMLWHARRHPARALMLLDRFLELAPAQFASIVVTHVAAAPSHALAEHWAARTTGHAAADPELDHRWMQIWVELGDLERATDHAESALRAGYDPLRLRHGLRPNGGLIDPSHRRLTSVARYRALFRSQPTATRVEHPTLGEGTLLRTLDGDKLEIAFDRAGLKVIARRFVRMIDG